jgi:thermostable 8-oxoguanine DNA glycosylase
MRFNKSQILKYASLYDKKYLGTDNALIETEIKEILKKRKPKFLTRNELSKIGRWKSPRIEKHCSNNDDSFVKSISKFSFTTKNEQARIESLLVFKGVSWPVASTILHFAFPDKYPILDFRVLEAIGWKKPAQYNFEFWKKYCSYLRKLAAGFKIDLRILDKALWQMSKEKIV